MTKYHILLNLREKTMVFWTLAFPLLLGLFFYFGIGGIDEASMFQAIPVAVLEGEISEDTEGNTPGLWNSGQMFQEFLEGISGELIEIYRMEPEAAAMALEEGEISGIFDNRGDTPQLTLGASGIEESLLNALMDGYHRQVSILEDVQKNAEVTPDKLSEMMAAMKDSASDYVKEVSLGGREVSSVSPYYFALVAMACLYMCFLGETAAKRTQANISEIGKRICVSPVHRLKIVVSNGVSAYVISLVNITLIMAFLIKVVHGIDISVHPGYAVLTCMLGCLIGVTFGVLIESIGKWSQNIKSAILIGASIFCAFLAGLMIGSMKDIIEKHVPVINRINPAALIADSFYCICVYDDMERLRLNLLIMGIISLLFLLAAWLMTGRVRYDNL